MGEGGRKQAPSPPPGFYSRVFVAPKASPQAFPGSQFLLVSLQYLSLTLYLFGIRLRCLILRSFQVLFL